MPLFRRLIQAERNGSHSNAGFVVLIAIIEQMVGQSYFDYVREHIYKTAVMHWRL